MRKPENMLEVLIDKWRRGTRGPLPQLTSLQILNALVIIDREGPLGRRALAQTLQINDGVARGLLERLAEQRLISVAETGVHMSSQGKKGLDSLLKQLSVKKISLLEESDLIKNSTAFGVHLVRAYRPAMTGIAQRDEAIKAGAEGAVTISVHAGRLTIPPDNKNLAHLAPKENARLKSEFKPSDKDLIIIGFGRDSGRALAGALAAVLSLQS